MKRITIFEGPDGGGKSSAAVLYAQKTGALYVHHPAHRHIDASMKGALAAIYFASMVPAINNQCDVVLDRSWISEGPYGRAYRNGILRMTDGEKVALEHVASTHQGVVVMCLPTYDTCRAAWAERHAQGREMLDNEDQLRAIYHDYARTQVGLWKVAHDWTQDRDLSRLFNTLEQREAYR